jgi:hypothetical protein
LTTLDTTSPQKTHFSFLEHTEGSVILDELLRLPKIKPQPEVQFLNYYKEVPLYGSAKILHTLDDTLICSTNASQARAIEYNKNTIIKSKPLQHDVYAVAHYDYDTGEVALSGFSYVEVLSDRRASIRVRMHVPLSVLIEAGTNKIKGRLLDLSLDGCAIGIADKELMANFSFFYLNMDMQLKSRQATTNARVMAKLVKTEDSTNFSRCVFAFEHDKRSEDQIGCLIAERQAEIIRELR